MVSNKTLALFIIVTVILSLGGTLLSLNKLQELSQLRVVVPSKQFTGQAVGQVYLGISSNMSCNVDSNVSFGSSGQPAGWITISTQSNNGGTNYTDCSIATSACAGLQINNTGNVNINVTFNSSNDGATLLGGVVSDFNYTVVNGTTSVTEPGCRAGLQTAWLAVPTTLTNICQNLTANDTNDMMTIEFNITIGTNTPPGSKTDYLTINCAQN